MVSWSSSSSLLSQPRRPLPDDPRRLSNMVFVSAQRLPVGEASGLLVVAVAYSKGITSKLTSEYRQQREQQQQQQRQPRQKDTALNWVLIQLASKERGLNNRPDCTTSVEVGRWDWVSVSLSFSFSLRFSLRFRFRLSAGVSQFDLLLDPAVLSAANACQLFFIFEACRRKSVNSDSDNNNNHRAQIHLWFWRTSFNQATLNRIQIESLANRWQFNSTV